MASSKLVLVMAICIFTLFLLAPITATTIDDFRTSEKVVIKKPQALATASGVVAPLEKAESLRMCKDYYKC